MQRRKKVHFSEMMKKVHNKLQPWKRKMFSINVKVVLINNILNNILIYLLSTLILMCYIWPTQNICKILWNFKEKWRNKHWITLVDIRIAKNEGGLSFRSLFDVSKSLCSILWWILEHKNHCRLILYGTNTIKEWGLRW